MIINAKSIVYRLTKAKQAEQDAALLVKSMLSAVFYMHHHARVAHRDLKPENFLLAEPDLPIPSMGI